MIRALLELVIHRNVGEARNGVRASAMVPNSGNSPAESNAAIAHLCSQRGVIIPFPIGSAINSVLGLDIASLSFGWGSSTARVTAKTGRE